MKTLFSNMLLVIVCSLFSCNSGDTKQITEANKKEVNHSDLEASASDKAFQIDRETLTTDFDTWYNYVYNNVQLSRNFIGLDLDPAIIDKSAFLNKLIKNDVLAFKIKIEQGKPVYKLYKI